MGRRPEAKYVVLLLDGREDTFSDGWHIIQDLFEEGTLHCSSEDREDLEEYKYEAYFQDENGMWWSYAEMNPAIGASQCLMAEGEPGEVDPEPVLKALDRAGHSDSVIRHGIEGCLL